MLKEKIIQLFTKQRTGLLPLPEDNRDLGFAFRNIFGGTYTPKFKAKKLSLLPVKSQNFNTCGWTSLAVAKEPDEKTQLDERCAVIMGKKDGLISGDGFSNLRDNEKILKDYGICEKGKITTGFSGWEQYSNQASINDQIKENAKIHRSQSFSRIYSVNEIYQALDNGRPVRVGVAWRSTFNMSAGFKSPFVLNFRQGYLVGGHAVTIYGYDTNYYGQKVLVIRNTFGASYGDNGDFYILERDLQTQIDIYGAYTNLDLMPDIINWLATHQGKVVKGDNPNVFLIEKDTKRLFKDLASLYSWGFLDSDIITVSDEYLSQVKQGADMDFWSGPKVKAIKAIIQQKENLKPIFQVYFSELFK